MSAAATHTQTVVQLSSVCKTYLMGTQQVKALDNVSIGFERGSFWALMGPSGSGKSTMLNLLGCLDRPTSGTYLLNEQDVNTLSDDELSDLRLKYLGFIFQSFNLIPQLTVRENIELPLYYLGWEPEECTAKAELLAAEVGLKERLNHRPTELSGGQMQRVAIARSLANEPLVLLADEPTGNLDSSTGDQIVRLLQDLNEKGKTIIMVTHEPDVAMKAKQRLYMRDGKIERMEGV
ncbi:MAG TPA: ABC transporter ATP-binding protein [Planctomycetota bacterium]|nr:ABC transporter ATP-binding protein [Planctomycetota bacterium]